MAFYKQVVLVLAAVLLLPSLVRAEGGCGGGKVCGEKKVVSHWNCEEVRGVCTSQEVIEYWTCEGSPDCTMTGYKMECNQTCTDERNLRITVSCCVAPGGGGGGECPEGQTWYCVERCSKDVPPNKRRDFCGFTPNGQEKYYHYVCGCEVDPVCEAEAPTNLAAVSQNQNWKQITL